MYAVVVCPSVCLSVRQKPVLYRNDYADKAGFWQDSFVWPVICYKEIRVPPKMRVLPFGTLPQTLDLENFATASRWCGQQNSLMVEPADYTYDGRARLGWVHKFITGCWLQPSNNSIVMDLLYSCSYTVVQQLAKFWQTHRVARAVCGSRASWCTVCSMLNVLLTHF